MSSVRRRTTCRRVSSRCGSPAPHERADIIERAVNRAGVVGGIPFRLSISHVGIFVSDLDRSIAWYEEMLGYRLALRQVFAPQQQPPIEMAWMKNRDHYIELQQSTVPKQEFTVEDYLATYGTKHLCLEIDDPSFDDLVAYLEDRGVEFRRTHTWQAHECGKPTGSKVIYFKDPDGILVEVIDTYTPGEY